jgi:hypothetical protein
MTSYEQQFSLERRKKECQKILEYWSDKIPIIAERAPYSNLGVIPKSKILCPNDTTIGQLKSNLQKKLMMDKRENLYLFISNNKNSIPSNQSLVRDVYEKNKSEDGFLYISYKEHETFGFNDTI